MVHYSKTAMPIPDTLAWSTMPTLKNCICKKDQRKRIADMYEPIRIHKTKC